MIKPLTGMKIAVLAANGFDEKNFTDIQKDLQDKGAVLRIISTNQGLVNGWDGTGWGHNYAVDTQLNSALGVDYSALVIIGGQRSVDKLKLTAHTRRFIGSFMASQKPVIAMGDALNLMSYTEQLDGRNIAGDETCREETTRNGAIWQDGAFYVDEMLLSGVYDAENKAEYFSAIADLLGQNIELDEAA